MIQDNIFPKALGWMKGRMGRNAEPITALLRKSRHLVSDGEGKLRQACRQSKGSSQSCLFDTHRHWTQRWQRDWIKKRKADWGLILCKEVSVACRWIGIMCCIQSIDILIETTSLENRNHSRVQTMKNLQTSPQAGQKRTDYAQYTTWRKLGLEWKWMSLGEENRLLFVRQMV